MRVLCVRVLCLLVLVCFSACSTLRASPQDAGVMERGLTISLKKNGRVAARRLGTPEWRGLVAEVEGRRNAGMDVVNM